MACPYFFPTQRTFSIGWAFPRRLPLGAGFCGTCRAGLEEVIPDDPTLRDFCNLGHAHGCSRMPSPRNYDSLRFSVARDENGTIVLNYVFDRQHAPAGHGQLAYDCAAQRWISTLDEACAQRQAECYLSVYLERRPRKNQMTG